MPPLPSPVTAAASGRDPLAARRLAVLLLGDVLGRRLPLDERWEVRVAAAGPLSPADRGLARAIATEALRRLGTLRRALGDRLERGLPPRAGPLESILLAGAAQILLLAMPAHAVVDTAVALAREDAHARHFAGLVNAVLRRIAVEREAILAGGDPLDRDTPPWLAARWIRAYGREAARAIALAHMHEAPIDITLRNPVEAPLWSARLGAIPLPQGSLRLTTRTAIPQLPGYAEGAWWVQDAAASLPARVLAVRPGERVLDLCAAPGGKTLQLAAAGAEVTAVDRSGPRLQRLRENLDRTGLAATLVEADALAFEAGDFDAVLLDAPCSATGTLRRHPDVAWTKTLDDVLRLARQQSRLLAHAARCLRPGGRLVYATCSLEPEEGEAQVAPLLAADHALRRVPIAPHEVPGFEGSLTADGDLRTLPHALPADDPRLAGVDGFFAARVVRREASP